MVNFCSKGYFLSPVLLKRNLHVRPDTSCRKLVFLDALASFDLKLSVREVCGKSKWKFKMAFAMKGGEGGGLEGVSFAIKLF